MILNIISFIFTVIIFGILFDGARLMLQDAEKRHEIRKKLQEEQNND
jgi:hypothetical protein